MPIASDQTRQAPSCILPPHSTATPDDSWSGPPLEEGGRGVKTVKLEKGGVGEPERTFTQPTGRS